MDAWRASESPAARNVTARRFEVVGALAQVSVPEEFVLLAAPRVGIERFESDSPGSVQLTVLRAPRYGEGWAPLPGSPSSHAHYKLDGERLLVDVADDPWATESALRMAWSVVTTRVGGFMLHSCAVTFGGAALVASAQSGGGKSTLARLARAGGATLLSDEVVLVLPGGRIAGTPFRSDADNPGTPTVARAAWLVGLEKARAETMGDLEARAALNLVASQTFGAGGEAVAVRELRQRQMSFLSAVRRGTLAFRKDPGVARFVEELLRAA